MSTITETLFQLQDAKYQAFQAKLLPTLNPDTIIGVRTPELRKMAKSVSREASVADFLHDLPHTYFEENQLHVFVISECKDFESCVAEVEKFLPYVDNWATCDQLLPKVFKKRPMDLLPHIEKWLQSSQVYTVRYAIGLLMQHFLDGLFHERYLEMVANVRSEAYYVNMMIAWYYATALAKQYTAALPYIEGQRLEAWTHNKAIQKAIESYRITAEQKEYLRTLKVRR